MDRKRYVAVAASLALALAVPTGALAAANSSGTGLPSQSCEDQSTGPAGFDSGGFIHAQSQYNPTSQYDVACYQLSHKHSS